ncbi:hypothetical protein SDC9_111407 [bioreactor metagenome]|uniref:Uncharacterized protein n=1 Tax=bioreactor metagenome TaxID=1076179 RepID=A0A645BGF7_9ZZZZ
MIERYQNIGFTFEVVDDRLPHQWIRRLIDHFFYGHQLHHVWKVKITGTVNRTHTTYTHNILDLVTFYQNSTCHELVKRGG